MTWTSATLRRVRAQGNPPVPYVGSVMGGLSRLFGSADNRESEMRMYSAVGTLFSVVSLISNTQASVKWHLYRKAKSGKAEDRAEVTSHPALDMWQKPNDFYTQHNFIEAFQQHLELVGEADWVIERNPAMRSIPLGLWPVRPDRIEPMPHPEKFLSGFVYHGPDGEKVPLQLDEVIQIKMPNPLDPYRGMGPVQSLLADLDSVRYSAEWNRNFFINNAEPGGIIEVPDMLSDPDFNTLTRRWAEQHRGVANAHRVAILEMGKWIDRKFTQRDMQFVEMRNVGRDVIREAFRIHPHMLGQADDVNLANALAADHTYAQRTDVPRADRIKDTLNHRFLPMFGNTASGLEFDFDSPVPANQELENATLEARTKSAKALVEAGYDRAAVLEACDLPDIAVSATPPVIQIPQKTPETVPAARFTRIFLNVKSLPPDELPDISEARTALDVALAALLARWETVRDDQKRQLITQIETFARDGNLSDLTQLTVDRADGTAALLAAMTALAATAGRQVTAEAAAQGVVLGAVLPPAAVLSQVADVTAALLADELAVTAARAAMQAHGASVTAEKVAENARTALDGLSMAGPEKQLGGALHGTMNTVRIDTLRAGPEGAVYAQEMNDRNTCKPCAEVNGRYLGLTSEISTIEQSYPNGAYGGYINCEGGVNCRGTVVGVWRKGQGE